MHQIPNDIIGKKFYTRNTKVGQGTPSYTSLIILPGVDTGIHFIAETYIDTAGNKITNIQYGIREITDTGIIIGHWPVPGIEMTAFIPFETIRQLIQKNSTTPNI